MPMTYRIDPEARMLFVVATGVTTQAERVEAMLGWINDPAFTPGLDTFCDFSTAESTPRLSDLRELVATIGDHAHAESAISASPFSRRSRSRSAWRVCSSRWRSSRKLR